MLRKAGTVFRLAFQDLKANLMVHAVAATVISAAFLTVGLFVLTAANLDALTRYWEKKIQVSAYLEDSVNKDKKQELSSRLYSLAGVESVEYVSKQQAMSDFKKMLGEDADLLEGIEGNPLPASFLIRLTYEARDVERVRRFSREIESWEGVSEVDYGGSWLDSFSSAMSVARAAVLVLGALIVVAVVFIISNTIRLTMYSRKEEIGIMKLVGASNLLIRLPFVLEGILQGLVTSALGVGALWILYLVALKSATWPGVFAGFSPVFISGTALLAIVAGGALLGAMGSLSRVSDFLRI
ncbi:MAG: permease-like cell division protein FtsX [bacterium]